MMTWNKPEVKEVEIKVTAEIKGTGDGCIYAVVKNNGTCTYWCHDSKNPACTVNATGYCKNPNFGYKSDLLS